jgi:hypothetical protein
MQLRRHLLQVIAALFIFSVLASTVWTSKTGHANIKEVQHTSASSVLQWPFSPSEGPWKIISGYNDDNPPPVDHNCNRADTCYERYGLDFIPGTNGTKTVYGPATSTGHVWVWPADPNNVQGKGYCFVFAIDASTYVQVCHVDFLNGQTPTSIQVGVPVGTMTMGNANHIHINLFTSSVKGSPANPTDRTAVPFSGQWTIGGCDYPNDPNNAAQPGGQYGGQPVPCSGQGGTPILTFHWGSNSSQWSGINRSRPVFVEVRSNIDSADLFSQSAVTDSTGTATLTLTGLVPGTYNVLIKPQGFLRQKQPSPVSLVAGTNDLTFSMTQSGTQCNTGQPTGQQLWAGDVDGNNVINSDDYTAIVSYFNKPVPSGYADLDGDGTFTGVDYNLWLRSICYFGGGTGAVVGDGGRSDTPLGQAAQLPVSQHGKNVTASQPGTLSLSPSSGNYRVNQTFNVNVLANSGGLSLDGADIVIHYNPSVLRVTNLTAGSVFAATLALANDPSSGEINISSVANQGQPVTVTGTLATIQFEVIGSDQTPQTLVTIDFNSFSNSRATMSQDGTVAQVLGQVYSASFTAGTLFVPHDYPTIAQALAAANPGETVLVAPGTYHELLSVPSGVTLRGQSSTKTNIDGSSTNNTAVIYLGNGATITNLTIRHSGTGFWDAAIWADQGPVTITNVRIFNSSMGIVRYCGSPPCNDTSVISNNLVAHNTTTGILIHGAQAQVQYNTVVDNHLQGITFEASGGQGISLANILTKNATGLTAPAPTSLVNNLLWRNSTTYGSNTMPGATDILADPLFVNALANNYNLHSVSPAFSADGSLGAYPFHATGQTPTHLTVTQNGSQVTISWQSTNATGYYVYVAQGSGLFSQVFNAGNTTSYTFSSLTAGITQFAVASYNSKGGESFATYLTATVAGAAPKPVPTVTPQPTVPLPTPTPCPGLTNHKRAC